MRSVCGEWIICSDGYYPYCSICNYEPPNDYKSKLPDACPCCGARMNKENTYKEQKKKRVTQI